jgi:hypothetical protein
MRRRKERLKKIIKWKFLVRKQVDLITIVDVSER